MAEYAYFHFEGDKTFLDTPLKLRTINTVNLREVLKEYRNNPRANIITLYRLLIADTIYCMRREIGKEKYKSSGRHLGIYDNIEFLALPTRAENALKRADVQTIGELTTCSRCSLMDIPSIGISAVRAIADTLGEEGFQLLGRNDPPTFSHLWRETLAGVKMPAEFIPEKISDKGTWVCGREQISLLLDSASKLLCSTVGNVYVENRFTVSECLKDILYSLLLRK